MDWPDELRRLTRELDSGAVYRRDLAAVATALDEVLAGCGQRSQAAGGAYSCGSFMCESVARYFAASSSASEMKPSVRRLPLRGHGHRR